MKDDKVFIRHILEEINYMMRESKDLRFEDVIEDETLKRAFLRSLEVIGEATKNISMDFRGKYPEIKWKELTGLRDKLIHIHEYFDVNWNRVWDVIKNWIPEVKEEIERILNEIEGRNEI